MSDVRSKMLKSILKGVWASSMCLCRRDARRKIVRQDRQTRRPPLAGGWSVWGAE